MKISEIKEELDHYMKLETEKHKAGEISDKEFNETLCWLGD